MIWDKLVLSACLVCCAMTNASAQQNKTSDPYQCAKDTADQAAVKLGYTLEQPHQQACRIMPSDPGKSIVALAYLSKDSADFGGSEEMGEYDLDILIQDSTSGKQLSRLHLPRLIESDAIRFSGLSIDTGLYQLAPALRAFGIRVVHTGSSHANPYGVSHLSLFVQKGRQIHRVLESLLISKDSGEWDTSCAGNFTSQSGSIRIAPGNNQGMADLLLTTNQINTIARLEKDECKEVKDQTVVNNYRLQFNGKIYLKPAELQEQ